MFRLLFGRFARCFLLLFALLFFVQLNEAQTAPKRRRAISVKKSPKADEKKDEKKSNADAAESAKPTAKGRLPVIIIPGLIGSELRNKDGDKVWFNLRRAKGDDLRLPVSPNLKDNKDGLIVGDILRRFKVLPLTPDIQIYSKLVDSLQKDGYVEGKIDAPDANGYADTFYVFPYDWRLDNVENAQLLLKKLDDLRAKLNRPNLKFNIVAHSMGGLIARYAALYGNADLTEVKPHPTWRGASYINSISLIATPNGGATAALNSLLKGFSLFGGGKLNIPFIQKITKFDIFTIPSVYQLLPHAGAVRAFDSHLRPLKIDIYDPETCEKYGWAAYTDPDFNKNFEVGEQIQAKAYFRAVLHRAKLFQAALDAKPAIRDPIPTYYLGSECKQTVNGFIVRQNAKKDRWETEFGSPSFTRADGTKVSDKQTRKLLNAPGDGVVPESSLLYSYQKLGRLRNPRSGVLINDITISCDEHNRLTGNPVIDSNLMSILGNSIPETNPPKLVKPENAVKSRARNRGRTTRRIVKRKSWKQPGISIFFFDRTRFFTICSGRNLLCGSFARIIIF
ncbi:MAG: lipase/acyltransferase domain-containing protein [Pyrinomonadaceae bacterium]